MLPNVLQRSASDHVAVLAGEVRELLAVKPGETVVDATFGAGGHASLLAADLRSDGKLIAIDRDASVRTYFDRFKAQTGIQVRLLRGEFSIVLNQLAENGVQADAILLDLGVSSMQLDRPERGFSYAVDAPLDMRMDTSAELTARELVNETEEGELVRIFRRYGEERFAKQIARAIVRRRAEHPFERTGELVDTIKQAIPTPARFGDGHPAKRVFQALRIAVNDELGALEAALPAAVKMLRPGGRLGEAQGGGEGRLMVAWGSTARVETPALPRPRSRPAARPIARARAFSGVVWIVLFGALLAGVVAVNVAVLQLNVRLDGLSRERIELRADNARLRSQLSSASAAARIEAQARTRLGLVPADPSTTVYVDLTPRAK